MNHPISPKRQRIAASASALRETNDCCVRAITVVTGKTYEEVHAVCARHGRRPRKGMYDHQWIGALRTLGFDIVNRTDEVRRAGGKTTISVGRVLPTKPFIVHTNRHLSGWDGMELVDWAHNRRKVVNAVYEVVSKAAPVRTASAANALSLLDNGISVADLARALGTDDKGARRAIDRLRKSGHRIESLGKGVFRNVR
jgi:hypothetical protein